MSAKTILEFSKCCRCCLTTVPPFQPLFEYFIGDMLLDVTCLKMSADDGYPQQVCIRCIRKISAASNFKRTVLKSHQNLSQMLKSTITLGNVNEKLSKNNEFETIVEDNCEILQSNHEITVSLIKQPQPALSAIQYPENEGTVIMNDMSNSNNNNEEIDLFDSIEYLKECSQTDFPIGNKLQAHKEYSNEDPVVLNDVSNSTNNNTEIAQHDSVQHFEECSESNFPIVNKLKVHEENCKDCIKLVMKKKRKQCVHTDGSRSLKYCINYQKKSSSESYKPIRGEYLCNLCGIKFRWRSSLSKHLRFHTGRLYSCNVCGLKSSDSSYLKIHMLKHSIGNKPYSCDLCNVTFAQKSSMNYHKKKMHAASRERYCCSLCDKSFLTKPALHMHENNVHSDKIFKCEECDKEFRSSKSLSVHKRRHKKVKGSDVEGKHKWLVKQKEEGVSNEEKEFPQMVYLISTYSPGEIMVDNQDHVANEIMLRK